MGVCPNKALQWAQAVHGSGCLFYQGPVVGPRQCFAMCVCPTKALEWGPGGEGRVYRPLGVGVGGRVQCG